MKKLLLTFLVALTGVMTASADDTKTIYLNVSNSFTDNYQQGSWTEGNARFALYCYNSDTDNEWVDFRAVDNQTGIYVADMPSKYANAIAGRMNPEKTDNNFNDGVKWNQTGDINNIADNSVIEITGWGAYTLKTHFSYTVNFVNGLGWENVSVYAWKSDSEVCTNSWPGNPMTKSETKVGNYDVYTYTLERFDLTYAPSYVIFNNGVENTKVQTGDLNLIDAKLYGVEPLEITNAAGWATCVTTDKVDFTNISGLKAYRATVSGETVSLYEVGAVPAGTALILKGDVKSHDIPVVAETSDVANDLKGSATESKTISETDNNYALVVNGTEAQFTKMSAGTLAAGKAYLDLGTSGAARSLNVVFAGEATAVEGIAAQKMTTDEVYNLQGQRIAQPTKGLYIVNGKKVIKK